MFVELHVLQNFAPSNLNRDDTGSPKDCIFGCHQRARISSQSLKRTAREYVKRLNLLDEQAYGERSRLFIDRVAAAIGDLAQSSDDALLVARTAFAALGIFASKQDEDSKRTVAEYLTFLSPREQTDLVAVCRDQFSELLEEAGRIKTVLPLGSNAKKKARDAIVKAVPALGSLERALSPDIAMFGRMVADLPTRNVIAASQVAHAISTHRVSIEFDYYTAVDDLNPEDTAGAGMIGTVEFNSACYYRYANVDTRQLTENLGDDSELARDALAAFLRAMILATPSAKQNSMAAQNPPEFVLTVVRERGQLWSLANAFENPVRPDSPEVENAQSIVQKSIQRLAQRYGQLQEMFGEFGGVREAFVATIFPENLGGLAGLRLPAVPELVRRTADAAFAGGAA